MATVSAANTRYSVFGHVCADFSSPTIRMRRAIADRTATRVLGLEGFDRGKLLPPKKLMQKHKLTIPEVTEMMGWGNMLDLPFSKGGPAASAAQAIFQLAPEGTVAFRGALGKSQVGEKTLEYFKRYGMDTTTLLMLEGVPPSFSLVVNENIVEPDETTVTESRSFLHDTGANGVVTINNFQQGALSFPQGRRNVVMAGGTFLMPKFHPQGTEKLLRTAKEQGAFTILNTVHDSSEKWRLGKRPHEFIDLLIMDRDEAWGIAHSGSLAALPTGTFMDEGKALLNYFRAQKFKNVVITFGQLGAFLYTDRMISNESLFAHNLDYSGWNFYVPISAFIRDQKVPKYGLGCGDVTAGAFAIAVGEMMDPLQAALFAMSAGGVCALQVPGEVGGPCQQGGHRKTVDEVAAKMRSDQMREIEVLKN